MLADLECGRTFRVVNAGVLGYSTFQGLLFLEQEILPLGPDMLIAQFGINDASGGQRISDKKAYGLHRAGERSVLQDLNEFLLRRSGLTRLLSLGTFHARGRGLLPTTNRVPLEAFGANLEEMNRLARREGASFVLVTYPRLLPCYNEKIREVSARLGIPLADVAAKFDTECAETDLECENYLPEDFHPSAQGHASIAEEIFRVLTERGVLPCATSNERD